MRRFTLGLVAATALAVPATAPAQVGGRLAPQFVHYTLGSPTNVTISEMALPIFVIVPLRGALTLDVGTAFASAHVTGTGAGQEVDSRITGLTDTQIRLAQTLGNDLVVLTGGINLPTGRSTASPAEQPAAALIGSDFLSFPISSMGSGFGGTGGVALAKPLGDWNLGAGASVRHSMPFNPYEDAAGTKLHYTPGNETRMRLGLDHTYRAGRVSVGLTYSTFGNDDINGSIYNTGNRIMTQAAISDMLGAGTYTVSMWDLLRTSGTLADGSASGRENITDISGTYGLAVGGGHFETSAGGRLWFQSSASASLQTSLSARYEHGAGPVVVTPGLGLTVGRLATKDKSGASAAASVAGYRVQLAIRTK